MATIRVPIEEASRFGILEVDKEYHVKSFIEKPKNPSSDLVNMGVYLFNLDLLDRALWEDHKHEKSSHDFGKDILPQLIEKSCCIYAFPYSGYWMDVGTINSYWQAHMDLLSPNPPLKLYDRSWIIHTRTEERPPSRVPVSADIFASMLSDGCYIQEGAQVESSVLSPGVNIGAGAVVRESIIMTDTVIESGAVIERAIIDKHVRVGKNAHIGGGIADPTVRLAVIGKNSEIPAGMLVEAGAEIETDVVASDYTSMVVKSGETIQTKRKPYEI
jgi:glucose-1-phosphate adenylyltransferase